MDVEDAKNKKKQDMWIGGVWDDASQSFVWTDGSVFDLAPWFYGETFGNPFAYGEPSDSAKIDKARAENCLSTDVRKINTDRHQWNDAKCSIKKRYFCKVLHAPLFKTTATTTTVITTTSTTTTTTVVTTTQTESSTTSICDLPSMLGVFTLIPSCTDMVREVASLFAGEGNMLSNDAQCRCYNALSPEEKTAVYAPCHIGGVVNGLTVAASMGMCAERRQLEGYPCTIPGRESWTEFGGSCYTYNSDALSFSEAVSVCGASDSSLVLQGSTAKHVFLRKEQGKSGAVTPVWLVDNATDITSGSGSGNEASANTECMATVAPESTVLGSLEWSPVDCNSAMPFFCQLELPPPASTATITTTTTMTSSSSTSTITPSVIKDCSDVHLKGWHLHDYACYFYPNRPASFDGAEAACQLLGTKSVWGSFMEAHVTSVISEDEMKAIDGFAQDKHPKKPQQVWIGAVAKNEHLAKQGIAQETNFDFVDGVGFGKYIPFAAGEPSNGNRNLDEFCIATSPNRKAWNQPIKWYDSFCGRQMRFMCKVNITNARSVYMTTTIATTTMTTTTMPTTTTTTTTMPTTITTTTTIADTTATMVTESVTMSEVSITTDTVKTPEITTPASMTTVATSNSDPVRGGQDNLNAETTKKNCIDIPCGRLCTDECGWSKFHGRCIEGANTNAAEVKINLDLCPLPEGEAPFVCESIICGRLCAGNCGWSKKKGVCIEGGKTSSSEMSINAELCPGAIDAPATNACESIKCARLCQGQCGWSRGKNICLEGTCFVICYLLFVKASGCCRTCRSNPCSCLCPRVLWPVSYCCVCDCMVPIRREDIRQRNPHWCRILP